MEGWEHILDYGFSLELLGRGEERRIVDKATGRIVAEYTMEGRDSYGQRVPDTHRFASREI